jgi:RNA recognition motif-containing protein
MWVRNNKGNVFVGNLPPDFADERLAEAFDPYGIVLSAAVARDPSTGARLRYGFVDIATERAMVKAITALDGSEIDGCKLNVKPRERAASKKPSPPPRRPPLRTAPSARTIGEVNAPPPHRLPPMPVAAAQSQSAQSQYAQSPSAHSQASQSAQSQRALDRLPEIEPPPRRDFEVVRRPLRRGAPTFQVERRPLPRRV